MAEYHTIGDRMYGFNDVGQLREIDDYTTFIFTNQTEYEKLGEFVTERIYEMMCAEPYNLRRWSLSGNDITDMPSCSTESFVFVSSNLKTAEKLVIIIHGSGMVRAGQWSRRLIINETLEVGSQLPYIQRCLQQGWAVVVTNTNDNYYVDIHGKTKGKFNSESPEEHAINIWNNVVRQHSAASEIAIIAHSYGGEVTTTILRNEHIQVPSILGKIKSIALTDAMFSANIFKEIDRVIPTRNWVTSDLPLNELIGTTSIKVSAGTTEHERTSHCAINSVFQFIDEYF